MALRIGTMVGEGTGEAPDVAALVARTRQIEALGFDTAWVANIQLDAIVASAVAGAATERIEIGTAVVPTYPRHPFAMAQGAATTQAVCGGRFALGIGLSHRFLVENMLGLSYASPAAHMHEYLEVLGPLLRGEAVAHKGERYRVQAQVAGFAPPVPVLVAALGPRMLELTGRLAEGTITWAAGLRTLEGHVGPILRTAARDAGRGDPRIVAGLPIAVTSDPARAREAAAKTFAMYRNIPSYRAMLDREGAGGLEDVAIVGDASEVEAGLARLTDVGVTDLCAACFEAEPGSVDRTLELLASLRRG